LLDYDNDPPSCVDLNDPELENFDPHADYSLSPTSTEDEEAAPTKSPSAPAHPWALLLYYLGLLFYEHFADVLAILSFVILNF
jgi:hypothetical protein